MTAVSGQWRLFQQFWGLYLNIFCLIDDSKLLIDTAEM